MQLWHCILVPILEYSRQVVKKAPKLGIKVFKVVNCSFILKLRSSYLLPREIHKFRTPCKGDTRKTESKFECLWCKQVVSRCCCSSQGRTWLIRRVFLQWHPDYNKVLISEHPFLWLPDANRNSQTGPESPKLKANLRGSRIGVWTDPAKLVNVGFWPRHRCPEPAMGGGVSGLCAQELGLVNWRREKSPAHFQEPMRAFTCFYIFI